MRTKKIKLLSELLATDIPKSEYSIVNSAWLAMMGLRINGDLDIIISKTLWRSHFSKYPEDKSFGVPGPFENRIRVHPLFGGVYMRHCNVHDPDELIFEKSISVEGIKFIEPQYYFRYKVSRYRMLLEHFRQIPWWRRNNWTSGKHVKTVKKFTKDSNDLRMLKEFFSKSSHQSDEWRFITPQQWGGDDVLSCNMSTFGWIKRNA